MKKALFFLLLLFSSFVFSSFVATGQSPASFNEKYFYFISHARNFREAKDYRASALSYDSAFQAMGGRGRSQDFYDAACSRALAGDVDSAFLYLEKAAREGKWARPDETARDKDLTGLSTDKRWPDVLDRMKLNRLENEHKIDLALEDTLNQVYTDDQSGRLAIDSIEKRFGRDSPQMDSLWNAMGKKDSLNLIIVKEILGRHSWPGPDEVGERASTAVFLVIQHSDSLTQLTCLPLMRTAVQLGAARAEDLALLEDRILTEQGKPQIYGSQVRMDTTGKASFFPILDEVNVNRRRATVGLGPLEDYARYFGIDYRLPAAPATSAPPAPSIPAASPPLHQFKYEHGQQAAQQRPQNGDPRIAPVAVALTGQRQQGMHDPRAEIPGRVYRITRGAAWSQPNAQHQQAYRQGIEGAQTAGGGCNKEYTQYQDKGGDGFRHQIVAITADSRRRAKDA
jgi:hypothetical protein